MIIAIDGPDYSGKSLLATRLSEWLPDKSDFKTTHIQNFPSKYPWGLLAREALVSGDRDKFTHYIEKDFIHVSTLIAEGVIKADLIILDRYFVTTYAHQNHTILLDDAGLVIPDLYMVFDTKYETMVERTKSSGVGWDEAETSKYRNEESWSELNSKYLAGLEHYKPSLKDTMVQSSDVDIELSIQNVYNRLLAIAK